VYQCTCNNIYVTVVVVHGMTVSGVKDVISTPSTWYI